MKKFIMALMLCLVSIAGTYAGNPIYGYTTNTLIWNYTYQEWQALDNGAGIRVALYDNDIYINSSEPQHFRVVSSSDEHYNQSGHVEITCYAIDADNSRCTIRVVFRDDAQCEAPLQLYIIYSNISYVYNVIPIQSNTTGI